MTPDRMTGWEAVGRITFARTGAPQTCTGTLVTPNKVLTAAHCVSRQFGKAAAGDPDLIFQAGKSGVSVVEVAEVARISYHPFYEPGAGLENVIPHDVAVLHLAAPMTVTPLPVVLLQQEPAVQYLAHRADGRNPPRLYEDCPSRQITSRVLEVACPAISGNSGGGVLIETEGGKAVIAVISAAGDGIFYAALPDFWLGMMLGAE